MNRTATVDVKAGVRVVGGAGGGASRVRAVRRGGMQRVIATEAIAAGGVVLEFTGELVERASRYSLQVGEDVHLLAPEGDEGGDGGGRYAWRYLNHSCDPNAKMVGMRLVAVRGIGRGDEVTFDYNTTEWEMAEPFVCGCGVCGGREIGGYSRLSEGERAALAPRLAEHLRRRAGV